MNFFKKIFKINRNFLEENSKKNIYLESKKKVNEIYPEDKIQEILTKYYFQHMTNSEKKRVEKILDKNLILKLDYNILLGTTVVMIDQITTDQRTILILNEIDQNWNNKKTILGEISSDINFGYKHVEKIYP